MKIYFFEPSQEKKTGGLAPAIQNLCDYLLFAGFDVQRNNKNLEPGAVAHFHALWEPGYISLARQCRTLGIPYIVSPHGMLEPWAWRHKFWKKWPYFFLVEKLWMRRAAALLATSSNEASQLKRFFPSTPISIIPLGLSGSVRPDYVGARRKLGWSDERILLFLSRIHPKKGLDLLLQALRDLPKNELGEMRLVVVGGGDAAYLAGLKQWAALNQLRLPKIEWKGEIWSHEKWLYLQGADLFCLPSHSENFGLAVLEAAQVGTPVLTTTATPWRNLGEQCAAFISEPTVASVREQLSIFFRSPVWSESDREESSRRIHAAYGWETVGKQYESFYRQIAWSFSNEPC